MGYNYSNYSMLCNVLFYLRVSRIFRNIDEYCKIGILQRQEIKHSDFQLSKVSQEIYSKAKDTFSRFLFQSLFPKL